MSNEHEFAGEMLQNRIIKTIANKTGEGMGPIVSIELLNELVGERPREILFACDELMEEDPQPINSSEVGETTVFWVTDFGRDMYEIELVEQRDVFQNGGKRSDVYRSNGVRPQLQVEVSYDMRVREELEEVLGEDHIAFHRMMW